MWTYPQTFDVIVIGAGHAGIEASAAAARLGCETLLLTQNLDTIGQMSCNPAIGGLAKGHMVREIDALGGLMAENCDATGIQFRMLNANKGPSVRAPRAQCDKKAYQFRMKALLEATPRLRLMQGNVAKLLCTPDGIEGIVTNLGLAIGGKGLVVVTRTFLRGLVPQKGRGPNLKHSPHGETHIWYTIEKHTPETPTPNTLASPPSPLTNT